MAETLIILGVFLSCQSSFSHIMKYNRINLGLEKSHVHDAFVIVGGTTENKVIALEFKQVCRNILSLDNFYNVKYRDTCTGKKGRGQDLFRDGHGRPKEKSTENIVARSSLRTEGVSGEKDILNN